MSHDNGRIYVGNSNKPGSINISGSIAVDTFYIDSNSFITQTGGTAISGTTLTATAVTAITLDSATNNMTTVNLTSGSDQNITYTDADAVDIALANAAGGDVSITAGGNVTDSGTITANLLTVDTSGAASLGAITLNSAASNVSTINLTSGNNQSITYTDAGSVAVELANAGAGNFTLTSGGAVTESGAGVDVIAGVLTVDAQTGIDLDTTVTSLDLSTAGAGNITIDETNAIILTDVDTANGSITITAAGAVTATDVASLTDNDANDISITGVGINVVSVNAGAAGDATLDAGTGAIAQSGGGVDIVADVLTADAQTGIDLDTTVTSLDLSTAGAGNITIDETNAITITDITCANGNIQVTNAAGDMNLLVTTANGNTVTLEATTGAITNGNAAATNVTSTTLDITALNDIGSAASPLTADITTLTATSTGGGNIYINIVGDRVIIDNVNQNYTYSLFTNKIVDIRNLTVTGAGNSSNITTSFGDIIVKNVTCDGPVNLTTQSGSMVDNVSNISGTRGNFSVTGIIGTREDPININLDEVFLYPLSQQGGFSGALTGRAGSIATTDAPGLVTMNGNIVHVPNTIKKTLGSDNAVMYEDERYEASQPVLKLLTNLANTIVVPEVYEVVSPYIDTTGYILETPYDFSTGPYLQ